jgi:hypothetical protein
MTVPTGSCAVVGMPDLGLVAAREAGIELSRLALAQNPGDELVAVTCALPDGLEIVAVAGTKRLRAARSRKRPLRPWSMDRLATPEPVIGSARSMHVDQHGAVGVGASEGKVVDTHRRQTSHLRHRKGTQQPQQRRA